MSARKSAPSRKIDWSTAFTACGCGIACMGMGALVYWAVRTSGASGPSGNALKTSQRIVALLPNSVKEKLAFAIAVVMFLGGLFFFVMACYGIIKDLSSRG